MYNTQMNLAYWLLSEGFPWDNDASEYEVGEPLTFDEAKDIMRIVARGAEFDLNDDKARQNAGQPDSPYHSFIRTYAMLMMTNEFDIYWADKLLDVLPTADKNAVEEIVHSYY